MSRPASTHLAPCHSSTLLSLLYSLFLHISPSRFCTLSPLHLSCPSNVHRRCETRDTLKLFFFSLAVLLILTFSDSTAIQEKYPISLILTLNAMHPSYSLSCINRIAYTWIIRQRKYQISCARYQYESMMGHKSGWSDLTEILFSTYISAQAYEQFEYLYRM